MITGMAPVPGGGGYWLIDDTGAVFAFGSATVFGSMGGLDPNFFYTTILATPTGQGYHLFTAAGAGHHFGDAVNYGSLGAKPPASSIVSVAILDPFGI